MHDKDKTHVIVKREIEYEYRLPCNLLKKQDEHFHIIGGNHYTLHSHIQNIIMRQPEAISRLL